MAGKKQKPSSNPGALHSKLRIGAGDKDGVGFISPLRDFERQCGSAEPSPPPRTIPAAQHQNYILLCDCAAEMAKDGEKVETCWRTLFNAFWRGELPALFVFTRQPLSGPDDLRGHGVLYRPRDLLQLPPRDVLAGYFLGHEPTLDAAAFAELEGWTLQDYQQLPEPFCTYINIARDPPDLGLAISETAFRRSQSSPPQTQSRRGRHPRADWEVVELALGQEIDKRGFPNDNNDDPKWRCQADVERWTGHFLVDRQERVGESRIREKVSEMLKRIKAAN
jgi:hypothetical protein